MKKKNLMTVKDNPLMKAYRENPRKVREIFKMARNVTNVDSREQIKGFILAEVPPQPTYSSIALNYGLTILVPFCLTAAITQCLTNSRDGAFPAYVGLGGALAYSVYDKIKETIKRSNYAELRKIEDINLEYRKKTGQLEAVAD